VAVGERGDNALLPRGDVAAPGEFGLLGPGEGVTGFGHDLLSFRSAARSPVATSGAGAPGSSDSPTAPADWAPTAPLAAPASRAAQPRWVRPGCPGARQDGTALRTGA